MFSYYVAFALPLLVAATAVSAQTPTAYNRQACASSFVERYPGVPSGLLYRDDHTCEYAYPYRGQTDLFRKG
jgi:hypothetical protein